MDDRFANPRAGAGLLQGTAKPPAPPTAPIRTVQKPAAAPSSGVKDTLEAILVAFILAFIFRAFVVEAFVIPTGSMAPTLLGAHMRFHCPDCAYEFTVNYSGENVGDDVNIPSHVQDVESNSPADRREGRDGRIYVTRRYQRYLTIYCPNCGMRMPAHDPKDPANGAAATPIHFGDRILVLKYLYLFSPPPRWDVVVFKSPADPKYAQNFIKRLVGLPNESLMILDGDIYVGKPDQTMSQFQVQRKPRQVQETLWRIIYDNDFLPQGLNRNAGPAIVGQTQIKPQAPGKWVQPWEQTDGGGWDVTGRVFQFKNENGQGTLRFNPTLNPSKHALTDWLAYAITATQTMGRQPPVDQIDPLQPRNTVSDLKLNFFYERQSGEGPLVLTMSKLGDQFIATLTPDKVSLVRRRADGTETLVGEKPFKGNGGPTHVEFTNADYEAKLRLNDEDVLMTGDDYRPDVEALLDAYRNSTRQPAPQMSIDAKNQTAALRHVSLWRDIYYTNRDPHNNSLRWGIPDEGHIAHLGPEEYFVLGDNSLMSGDARYWDAPIELPDQDLSVQSGRVPGRFMLGKAFFVYWPAGYRVLPSPRSPGLVPNFGEMRMIR